MVNFGGFEVEEAGIALIELWVDNESRKSSMDRMRRTSRKCMKQVHGRDVGGLIRGEHYRTLNTAPLRYITEARRDVDQKYQNCGSWRKRWRVSRKVFGRVSDFFIWSGRPWMINSVLEGLPAYRLIHWPTKPNCAYHYKSGDNPHYINSSHVGVVAGNSSSSSVLTLLSYVHWSYSLMGQVLDGHQMVPLAWCRSAFGTITVT